MISRISVEDRNVNSLQRIPRKNDTDSKNPSFKGGGAWSAVLWGMQQCEKNPMVNVAVIDMLSAILPRTIVESTTNWFAGFEAFRRESSGLIVNCLIPSYVTLLGAIALNKAMMPNGVNMANCWADSDLINKAKDIYKNSNTEDKVKTTFKEIIGNIEGFEGKEKVVFKDILSEQEIENYANRLKELTSANVNKDKLKEGVKGITKEITEKTHVYENIHIGSGKEAVKANTVETLLTDTTKFFKEFGKTKGISIEEFAQKSKKLVRSKSALGLAVILPLAASMQYINRWITKKVSGVDGAPIYDDFGKNKDNNEQAEAIKQQSKEGLLKQKLISISSMIGVSLLSMMKLPSWNMLEFKGIFPTMDQARLISTTTFCSRMAAADDRNELAEATVRDIATFSGLYFLGDYGGKAAATIIQNKTGIELLNDTKPLKKDANIFERFTHWLKDVNIKSSEEITSKTEKALKSQNLKPTAEQLEIIKKEINRGKNLRYACQAANIGVSLVLLGIIVPIYTRHKTKKKHAEALKLAQETSSSNNNDKDKETSPTESSATKA